MFRLLFLIISFLLAIGPAAAQSSRSNSANNNSASKKTTYKQGEAWSITEPLGTHEPASLDTMLYGMTRDFVPAIASDAWASTGALAAEGINMIYFDRNHFSDFIFENSLEHWIPTFYKEKFYNVYIPTTLLSYNFGGNRNNHTDRLKGIFAGNVNRRIGIGANLDYLYTKGAYSSQAAKNFIYGLQGYYTGDRYEMQAFFNHYNSQNQENGGITDDLYITDPAVLQGGVTSIEPQSIPTNLSKAKNRLAGAEFYMSHAYKIGFWKDVTQENDTIKKQIYVPVTKFIYSFDYKYNHHMFTNADASEARDFWENTYFNLDRTEDHTHHWSISNTLGVSMIEGFQTWAKFGLSAYATYQINKYTQGYSEAPEDTEGLTPLPDGYTFNPIITCNRMYVGGRLERLKSKILRYTADAKFGVLGDVAGEFEVNGSLETDFKLGKDTVVIGAEGFFKNMAAPDLMQHYVSNHFIWDEDFGMTRSFRAGGYLQIPWTNTLIRAGLENVQNYVYFNANSLPEQYGGSIQVFSASIDQKLQFGVWNWNNTVTYQVSSNQEIIPLPALSIYSNMFLDFNLFKVLRLQIGLDCNYYTKYRGLEYQPATMQFHIQGDNPIWVGNYAVANAYLAAKLSKARFFILWSHVNQGLFSNNYFALPHYPIDPRQLRFGITVDFAN